MALTFHIAEIRRDDLRRATLDDGLPREVLISFFFGIGNVFSILARAHSRRLTAPQSHSLMLYESATLSRLGILTQGSCC